VTHTSYNENKMNTMTPYHWLLVLAIAAAGLWAARKAWLHRNDKEDPF
jgi:hypothetical protein